MLNYGLVETYKGQIKIRVLVNNGDNGQAGSTPTKNLPNAIIDSRERDSYKDGDTVIVGYVYDDVSHPVILFPYGDREPTRGQKTIKQLMVTESVELPTETNIGNVKGSELTNIRGLNYLLVEKIKQMEDRISELNKKIEHTSEDICKALTEQ